MCSSLICIHSLPLTHTHSLFSTIPEPSLIHRGVKVWWDKNCLVPGVDWKEGFCAGLCDSRTYVCLLSRESINHPTIFAQVGVVRGLTCACWHLPLSSSLFKLIFLCFTLSCLALSCLVLSSLALTYSAFSNLIKLNLSHFIFFLLQSFRNLNASSPCDHVYLEMRLAIELKVCDMMS